MGTLRLEQQQALTGHEDVVWCVAWSPDGAVLASCGADRTVRLWGRTGGEGDRWACVALLEQLHSKTIRSLTWSPCGRWLATASFDGTVGIWERGADGAAAAEWECVATLEGHENEVKCVAWSPCGAYLATCGRDKSVWVWEAQPDGDFECAAVLHGHSADVKALAWQPRAEPPRLVSCSYDESLRLWAPLGAAEEEWECVQALPGVAAAAKEAAAAVRAARRGEDADALAAAAAEAAAAAAAGGGHADTVWAVAWHPSGALLASAAADGCIHTWAAGASAALERAAPAVEAHSRPAYGLDWSPAPAAQPDSLLASAGGDDALRVWRLAERGTLGEVASAAAAHAGDVNAVRWHPREARLLATGGDDACVRIWRLVEA